MPWREVNTVSLRQEFVQLVQAGGVSVSELCERFQISRKTGYKWLARAAAGEPLSDLSRRPRRSPARTPAAVESAIVRERQTHPAWGARKLRWRLEQQGLSRLPASATVHAVLKRHGLIAAAGAGAQRAWIRFEHAEPNDLWQMDFKGNVALRSGRCHPLTVLDDHSRYNVALQSCGNEQTETVRTCLSDAFRIYGLPWRMTMDNGSPWGAHARHELTPLTVWLIRLGIGVSHSRPYHPQTQGKDERFHRTLKAEVLNGRTFTDCAQAQRAFDAWRAVYNTERPHQALGMAVPAQRYRPSARAYPEQLPPIEYGPDDGVRKVQAEGWISFQGHDIRVPRALRGERVAVRPINIDGLYEVYFCHQLVAEVDLKGPMN